MSNINSDFQFALKIHADLNKEFYENTRTTEKTIQKFPDYVDVPDHLNATQNIAHPDWENVDPTPDIHSMFGAFDLKFFQGKLQCVSLEWSKRMYNCAGICYSRKNQHGMQCTIRLSEPLLKLRSRKNLVETLLHEMIHAYLFILGIRENNGGHGPNFQKIMIGINRASGTNITVYHTFHDEVALYKTHWWRCNGICQHRSPFFGYVRRTSNRAPGQNDRWWFPHKKNCGGTFVKIKEPEKKPNSKKGIITNINANSKRGPDIRHFFPNTKSIIPKSNKNRGTSTLVIRSLPTSTFTGSIPVPSKNRSLANVVELKDLTEQTQMEKKSSTTPSFSGAGHTLGSINISDESIINERRDNDDCLENVRSRWNKRYHNSDDENSINQSKNEKRIKHSLDNNWKELGEGLLIHNPKLETIDISDSDSDIVEDEKKANIKKEYSDKRNHHFLSDIHQSFMDDDENDDILLIDGDFDDNIVIDSVDILDKTVVDDFSGDDTLLEEFNRVNKLFPNNKDSDIIKCPICQVNMKRDSLSEHLEGCLGITVKINPHLSTSKNLRRLPFYNNTTDEKKKILQSAGYEEDVIENILSNETNNQSSSTPMLKLVTCPICDNFIEEQKINEHVDLCLSEQN